jgi:hypothetical protein
MVMGRWPISLNHCRDGKDVVVVGIVVVGGVDRRCGCCCCCGGGSEFRIPRGKKIFSFKLTGMKSFTRPYYMYNDAYDLKAKFTK